MRQHYWNTIQKVMEHTGVPAEAWHNEWRAVARDKETWNQASEEVVETVKSEATARCEGMGLDRPVEEISSLALRAGGLGAMARDMRVCPKWRETLHPLGFTHHVKKCHGTRRKYHILIRSKVCSVCGVSMNRESIPRHEAMCRARRDALNPPTPVTRRITGKKAPGQVERSTGRSPLPQSRRRGKKKERHDGKKRRGAQRKEESCS